MQSSRSAGIQSQPNSFQALAERARLAQPQLEVDSRQFAEFLAARPGAAPEHNLDDVYLAFACSRRDRRALELFERRYLSQVGCWISGLRQQPAFADEVRQRVRERLLVDAGGGPRIVEYSGRGSLASWARVTAVREALDLIEREKQRRPAAHDPERVEAENDLLGATVDPELHAIRQRHLPQFREAFREALESLPASATCCASTFSTGSTSPPSARSSARAARPSAGW
jgi:RNA polymerase sigma-70 factor (ECF subfamily)